MQVITYCLSCKKDTKNIDPKVVKTKNNRLMMLSNVLFAIIKSLDSLKNNKQKDY